MMPDLGRYAFEVSLAYGVTLVLLAALVAFSVARARRIARELDAAESRRSRDEA